MCARVPVILDQSGEVGAHEPVQEDAAWHRVEQQQDVQSGGPPQRTRNAAQEAHSEITAKFEPDVLINGKQWQCIMLITVLDLSCDPETEEVERPYRTINA